MSSVSLESILKNAKKAIVIGIGGGGDIVGCIPTWGLARMFGVECILGGLPWERSVFDPVPGPRTFDEVRGAKPLNDTVWWVNKDTVTSTGVRFAEAGFSEAFGVDTLHFDITKGTRGVVEGIRGAMAQLDADLVVGVDVGGDAVAFGKEPGLMSPLADSIMTAALAELEGETSAVMGIFGFGSDGELTPEEVERSLNEVAKRGGMLGSWGITPDILREMERAVSIVATEASRIPMDCAVGKSGETTIRSGRRTVRLSINSTVTFYLSPRVVFDHVASTARAVAACRSLEEANDELHKMGINTELDLERDKLKQAGG